MLLERLGAVPTVTPSLDIQLCNVLLEETVVKEEIMHLHLCAQCGAVITIDEGRTCPHKSDHQEGLCEPCAQAQPRLYEIV